MSNAALNNVTAPDNYSAAATLDPGKVFDHGVITVLNQAIYWQAKRTATDRQQAALASWEQETFLLPGSTPIERGRVCGARVRAAIPAAQLTAGQIQAQVTIELVD